MTTTIDPSHHVGDYEVYHTTSGEVVCKGDRILDFRGRAEHFARLVWGGASGAPKVVIMRGQEMRVDTFPLLALRQRTED